MAIQTFVGPQADNYKRILLRRVLGGDGIDVASLRSELLAVSDRLVKMEEDIESLKTENVNLKAEISRLKKQQKGSRG